MNDWSAAQYLKFNDERSRPARDLLAQIPLASPGRIVDIGCGPGNSTALLASRFPDAVISGFDTSPDMLAKARKTLAGIDFYQADASHWQPEEPVDVLFSNAVFQWVPDRMAVMQSLLDKALAAGGVLAIQMPDNLMEPLHVLMREVAAQEPWAEKLQTVARTPMATAEEYYEALKPHCARLDIWHTIYNHPLDGVDAVVEWVKGTGLRPFIEPLCDEERPDFLNRYRSRLARAYPPLKDGKVLLPFPRLFILAQKG
ncbi:trans-aconitate 2-methyltransferase [Allorhizobium undicola]|uniref:trans-aconitate 2-methyltransferase n=1 Tax=Allorhizobium undicola TaxID=78527 RepID=UPI0004853326|nr:trans-aconitate 2-methyltransferase [Allorhizobium undicola]